MLDGLRRIFRETDAQAQWRQQSTPRARLWARYAPTHRIGGMSCGECRSPLLFCDCGGADVRAILEGTDAEAGQ